MKNLLAKMLGILFVAASLCGSAYAAETSKSKSGKASKSHHSTQQVKHADDEPEPDVAQYKSADYQCELGNSLTVFTHPDDDQHVAMRWKKRIYKLVRVVTSTGAQRFENLKSGLVWIGIPAKSMLLDSHKGQQLANECKTKIPPLAEVNAPALSTSETVKLSN